MGGHWQCNGSKPRRQNDCSKAQLRDAEIGSIQNGACYIIVEFLQHLLHLLSDATALTVVVVAEKLRDVLDDDGLVVEISKVSLRTAAEATRNGLSLGSGFQGLGSWVQDLGSGSDGCPWRKQRCQASRRSARRDWKKRRLRIGPAKIRCRHVNGPRYPPPKESFTPAACALRQIAKRRIPGSKARSGCGGTRTARRRFHGGGARPWPMKHRPSRKAAAKQGGIAQAISSPTGA